uniref:diguanylate cyclase n=1 Tax=Candidatus Kentrum sp. DK TaxID=2126562 RepID=A0A450S4W7_9GAMM|nr:MAG: diguanylate cyclase (GGDEF) domain-containing protein [Candidatus Kentron sp. DK]
MRKIFNEIRALFANKLIENVFVAALGVVIAALATWFSPPARAFLSIEFQIEIWLFLLLLFSVTGLMFFVYRKVIRRLKDRCKEVIRRLRGKYKEEIRQLRNKLLIDDLTGIYSSRALERKFEEMQRICRKSGKKLSVILFDIDDFKSINRDYGHIDANIMLRRLVRLVHEEARGTDVFIRMHDSGDEFVILVYNASATEAERAAERFRKRIHEYQKFSGRDNPVPRVITISSGVAEFNFEKDTFDSVKRRADKALLIAKETRNAVSVDWSYESPIET